MRIIKPARIQAYWTHYRRARPSLEGWVKQARAAEWANLAEVRQTFSSADPVRVASGKTVVVFNIGGNHYRLVTAIHYNVGKVFVLRFLTHAEYSKDRWKQEL